MVQFLSSHFRIRFQGTFVLRLCQTLWFLKRSLLSREIEFNFVFFSVWRAIWCRSIWLDHNSGAVHGKIVIAFEFCNEGSVHEHLFLYRFHWWFVIISTHVVTFIYFGDRWTFFELWAALAFRLSLVWSTFLGHKMSIFLEKAVENGPATFTAFVHVVAIHNLLGRQFLYLFGLLCIFQLHPGLDSLHIPHCKARATFLLVAQIACKIIISNISEIPGLRDQRVRYFIHIFVVFRPWLSLGNCLLKLSCIFSKFTFTTIFILLKICIMFLLGSSFPMYFFRLCQTNFSFFAFFPIIIGVTFTQ